MGDMLTLIEKAEEVYEKDEAEAAAAKLLEGKFTLDDFLDQMQQIKKMGPLTDSLKMLPGVPKEVRDAEIDDQRDRPGRGHHPLDDPRGARPPRAHRRRPAAPASPTARAPPRPRSTQLIKQFKEMQKMMKRMGGFGSKRMAKKGRKGARRAAGGGRASPRAGRRCGCPTSTCPTGAGRSGRRRCPGLPDLAGPGAPRLELTALPGAPW